MFKFEFGRPTTLGTVASVGVNAHKIIDGSVTKAVEELQTRGVARSIARTAVADSLNGEAQSVKTKDGNRVFFTRVTALAPEAVPVTSGLPAEVQTVQ